MKKFQIIFIQMIICFSCYSKSLTLTKMIRTQEELSQTFIEYTDVYILNNEFFCIRKSNDLIFFSFISTNYHVLYDVLKCDYNLKFLGETDNYFEFSEYDDSRKNELNHFFINKTSFSVIYFCNEIRKKMITDTVPNSFSLGELVCVNANSFSRSDDICRGYYLLNYFDNPIPNVYLHYGYSGIPKLNNVIFQNDKYVILKACIIQDDVFYNYENYKKHTFNEDWTGRRHQFDVQILVYEKDNKDNKDLALYSIKNTSTYGNRYFFEINFMTMYDLNLNNETLCFGKSLNISGIDLYENDNIDSKIKDDNIREFDSQVIILSDADNIFYKVMDSEANIFLIKKEDVTDNSIITYP